MSCHCLRSSGFNPFQNETLSQMIESGEIDALYTARAPSTFAGNSSGKVPAAVPDSKRGRAYYSENEHLPSCHTVVIARSSINGIAGSLSRCTGFVLAQRAGVRRPASDCTVEDHAAIPAAPRRGKTGS